MPRGIFARPKRAILNHPDDSNLAYVPLANKRGTAIINRVHAKEVGRFNWSLRLPTARCLASYAVTHDHRVDGLPTLFLHRLIGSLLGFSFELQIDHDDGNGLNNADRNLRPATGSQNRGNTKTPSNNTSGFKGVHLRKDSGRFVAGIVDLQTQRRKHLGTFNTAEEAALAYDEAARRTFGVYALVNFV